jgi:probable HAF family extracellular repeat protein
MKIRLVLSAFGWQSSQPKKICYRAALSPLRIATAGTLVLVAAGLVCVAANPNRSGPPKLGLHHHYQLIDLGTFGGPLSLTQDELKVLNRRGTVAGLADTSTPDPNYPISCLFCFSPFIDHAFQWRNGVLNDLGALPGVNTSAAQGISESGLSSGFSENGEIDPLLGIPEIHAVLWRDGQIIDLGTLEGGYESSAFTVNNRGQVTGVSLNLVPDPFTGLGTQLRTFLWDKDNGMQDLGTLGGPDAGIVPGPGPINKGNVEINERGQVVSCSYTSSIPNPWTGFPTVDPFLWDKDNGMQDLGTLGGTSGCAVNLNNRGQVVGYSNLAGDSTVHPFLWTNPGPMQDLGTLGGTRGFSNGINDAGDACGATYLPGDQVQHGFLWKDGIMTDLGALIPLPNSVADWINSREQVVGFAASSDFNVQAAFLWENGGPMVDLNTLVPPGSSLQLASAFNINDRGEISGEGFTFNGDLHTFLLIPCDEDHPGIEGCDYSLVDGAAAPSSRPAATKASGPMPPASLWRRNNRFHFPGRAIGPRN